MRNCFGNGTDGITGQVMSASPTAYPLTLTGMQGKKKSMSQEDQWPPQIWGFLRYLWHGHEWFTWFTEPPCPTEAALDRIQSKEHGRSSLKYDSQPRASGAEVSQLKGQIMGPMRTMDLDKNHLTWVWLPSWIVDVHTARLICSVSRYPKTIWSSIPASASKFSTFCWSWMAKAIVLAVYAMIIEISYNLF